VTERPLGASEALVTNFRASRDHETIEANRALLRAASAEATAAADQATAALAVVRSLAEVNRLLCDHQGSSTYTDDADVACTHCPHCGDF